MIRIIYGSVQPAVTKGTAFYEITLDDMIKHFSKKSENCIVWKSLETFGLDALDMEDSLFGSHIEGDTLYLCVTDGKMIKVKGREISPEYAFDEFGVEALSDYIVPGSDKIIHRYITPHEIILPDYEVMSEELLEDGYDSKKIFKDFLEIEA